MSDQDLSLKALSMEAARQASLLNGAEWSQAVSVQAMNVAGTYARRVRERWGITLMPGIAFSFNSGKLEIAVDPATDFDKLMWEALMQREGLSL
ncbi:hypothetical protein [uncultured Methylobacterium sp.]|jgi:hypothetical protein|uniref:hypothetical protein n=1 Tax=uncultured Methylobacterium sp. TaxID=157278 RepID=UPI002613298B|nr:hypothetical protein [uncultured Methylobacterium sp.]